MTSNRKERVLKDLGSYTDKIQHEREKKILAG